MGLSELDLKFIEVIENDIFFSPDRCVMRGSCGTKGWFGQSLPCPDDGLPTLLDDAKGYLLLSSICGAEYLDTPVCCTIEQVETLRDRFIQVDNLISSCPACRNNFRSLFCSLTCSPHQVDYLNITATQVSQTGQTAVKAVDFYVGEQYATGFYNSCKNVQFGATNGYAMDFLGGGAKNYYSFLKYLGDEKDIGSPFQIDFRFHTSIGFESYNPKSRHCADSDLMSRCTCIDCPEICLSLPEISLPSAGQKCHVGVVSCFSFLLSSIYCLAAASFLLSYVLQVMLRKRRELIDERLVLTADATPRDYPQDLIDIISNERPADVTESLRGCSTQSEQFGGEAMLLNSDVTSQPRQYLVNLILRRFFYRLGLICATSPWLISTLIFVFVGFLNLGWRDFAVETDPLRLWVAKDAESNLQKEFFETNFGPFYRTEQIFITASENQLLLSKNDSFSLKSNDNILNWDNIKWLYSLETDILSLQSSPRGIRLDDVCFRPEGQHGSCVVQSVTAWLEDFESYDEHTWEVRVRECIASPVDCRPMSGLPVAPQFVLGGIPSNGELETKDWLQAEAIVITYVLNDSLNPEIQGKIIEWEKSLREFLQLKSQIKTEETDLRISFSTGISLEEELKKSANTDVKIVIFSYLIMFLYITLTLGGSRSRDENKSVVVFMTSLMASFFRLFLKSHNARASRDYDWFAILLGWIRESLVYSKFTLATFSIGLVILSISSSVGMFSFLGVKTTLIIAEVIPFLVLAVGVDNVFLLVHELKRQNMMHGPNHVSNAGAGLSAILSPVDATESRLSSLYDGYIDLNSSRTVLSVEERVSRAVARVGPSILFGSVTEAIAFALGALVPMPAVRNFALYATGSVLFNAFLQLTVLISALSIDLRRTEATRVDCFPCVSLYQPISLPENSYQAQVPGRLTRFMKMHYVPFLARPLVKLLVLSIFGGICVASIISIRKVELGLDQRLTLPSDSYLIPYFDDLDNYYDVGPPLYFVVRGADVADRQGQRKLCGRFTTCDDYSLANVIEGERRRENSSFISQPAASWVDDFLHWLDPQKESCCRVRTAEPTVFCDVGDSDRLCRPCLADSEPAWNINMGGLPEGEDFLRYLRVWLSSPADEECALGGQAAYGSAVSFYSNGSVRASHFRTYHSPLKSQKDFIESFSAARRIAEEISKYTGTDVFPYSIFYVFFDQYAHIIAITQEILGLGLAAVLVISALFLGSWRASVIVTGVVASIVLSIMGVMAIWNISLNAISLVNLVIALGIAVEFCVHITRSFMNAGNDFAASSRSRDLDERVGAALVDVGPSVLSGITMTKLIGISVLGFTRSRLLETYYFRMWLTLIISGALHGLILLPVMLSLVGGPGYVLDDADEIWMTNAVRRYNSEEIPFLADYNSHDSDQ